MKMVRTEQEAVFVESFDKSNFHVAVRQAVLGLFEGQCTDASSSIVDSYDIDTFEEGEKEWWNSLMSKARPNIVYSDAYCGRKSLEVIEYLISGAICC